MLESNFEHSDDFLNLKSYMTSTSFAPCMFVITSRKRRKKQIYGDFVSWFCPEIIIFEKAEIYITLWWLNRIYITFSSCVTEKNTVFCNEKGQSATTVLVQGSSLHCKLRTEHNPMVIRIPQHLGKLRSTYSILDLTFPKPGSIFKYYCMCHLIR